MKLAEYAPGIPDKSARHEIRKVDAPASWEFGIHQHRAEKAGEHFDLRIGDPETGHAHSWAMRHLPKPGEVRLAVQQPTHTVEYMDFKGEISEGYGKGRVDLLRRDKAEVISSSKGHIRFNLYPGNRVEEYLLRRPSPDSDQWMLHNVTSTRQTEHGKQLPSAKPKYKVKEPEKLDAENPNTVWQAKIDGAHVLYQFKDTGRQARVLSYRPTERETGVIEHTQKLPDFHTFKVPSPLKNTILRGELYAVDKSGKALPSEQIGALLNSNTWKSREKQEAKGKLVPIVFDVVQWRGKNVENAPFAEKQKLLEEAVKSAPWLQRPRTASTPEEKQQLFVDVRAGKEPSTTEGVIEWHLDKPTPAKAKFRPEVDAYVKDVFMEKSQRGMAGGFTYSLTPGGPVVGRVGTGMSHAMKKDMAQDPEKYKGLAALVATTRGHTGRAPAFKAWHLDQDFPEGVKMAEQQEEKPKSRVLPTLAGLGTAAASAPLIYAAIRRPTYSANPALRAMQEASKGRFARAIPQDAPKTRIGRLFDRVIHDSDELYYWNDKVLKKPRKFDGLVHHADPQMADTVKGTLNPGLLPESLENLSSRLGDNKWHEYEYFQKHAPGVMPKTENLAGLIAGKKIPRSRKGRRQVFEGLQDRLKGRSGYVMKEVDGAQSSGAFPTEKDNLADLYEAFQRKGFRKKVEAFNQSEVDTPTWAKQFKELKSNPAYSGRVLNEAAKDPSKVIVQRKVDIAKPGPLRALVGKAFGNPASKEMRVHVIGGQALPSLTVPRFDPTSAVFDRDLMRGASDYAQSIVQKLPKKHQKMNFAMDIAPLEGGGYKLIESNPTSNSGLLYPGKNPLVGFKLRKELTGQWSPTVAGAGALAGSAAVGAGAYGAARAAQGQE